MLPPAIAPAEALDALARLVVTDVVDDDAYAIARAGVLDYLAVAIPGSREPDVRVLRDHIVETFAAGEATALGSETGVCAPAAAFLNSAAGHVLDYDDYNDAVRGHPTCVVLPAALAVAETVDASTREVLDAYIVGVEAETMIGRVFNPRHYELGWHPTATIGTFGAAVAAARLLRFDERTTRDALCLAASLAGGIKGSFGTFMKAGQVGLAALRGLQAADLAARGIRGGANAFGGHHSFSELVNGNHRPNWDAALGARTRWGIVEPGLVFKLYPCCGSTHPAIDAALGVRSAVSVDGIDRVDVYVHPRRIPHTDRPSPASALEAKFSMQYVVAAALHRGRISSQEFSVAALGDAHVRELTKRTHIHELPEDEQFVFPGKLDCFACRLRVSEVGGGEHETYVRGPRGFDPTAPVTDADIEAKFLDGCPEELWGDANRWLDGGESPASFMRRLRGAAAR